MAYTIQFHSAYTDEKVSIIVNHLKARIEKDGRFRAELTIGRTSKGFSCAWLRKVRLTKKKAYCGNHPGECPISSKPKPVSSLLEWEDWVKFHSIVNKALNRYRTHADVWTLPYDVKGKMWIRKGTKARIQYSWNERIDNYGRIVRDWNQGTEDQFT
jgi:hypothetical protein